MLASLGRRIFLVVAIALASTIGVVVALQQWARTTTEQRLLRAHEAASAECERLAQLFEAAPTPETRKRGRRDFGAIKSGFLDDALSDEAGTPPAIMVETRALAASESRQRGVVIVREATNPAGQPFVVAVKALPQGGYVWAAQLVGKAPDQQRLRTIVLLLALAMILLVVTSVHTVVVLRRDARSLRASLRDLGSDLGAPVARPTLDELGEIADGVTLLAHDLDAAQKERDRLATELAQKERLAALGRVVAGVAHEVRNPLAAIKLRADLAGESASLDPAVARDLADISREVARLDRFVKDLLVVSGRRDPTRVDTDLGALARDRVVQLAPWAKERRVAIGVKGAARAAVEADAVARALDNLLRNAVEASPEGGAVEVEIASEGAEARITVSDAGAGVDDKRRGELFEPFFTTKPDGSGLGLALSRAVAVAHGGSVLYSREASRTRFTLTVRTA
ncbi:MAG TPA: ATP-binding protein [Labilithrix sp.]